MRPLQHLGAALLGLAIFSSAAVADDPIRPDPRFTPGAVFTTDRSVICSPGYSKSVRHTSGHLKVSIYWEYGIDRRNRHNEIGHLIPLGLGGANAAATFWPESRDTQPCNASVKDRLEDYLYREACVGRMPHTLRVL